MEVSDRYVSYSKQVVQVARRTGDVPRIEFEAASEEELVDLAWRWVMGPRRPAETGSAEGDGQGETDLRRRQLVEVLRAIRGPDSRRLLREVAQLAPGGEALVLDAALRRRYDKTSGTAFAGIVAGPNKVMRRVAGRDLLVWDGAAGGYRMHPADAEIVLQTWAEE
jgi:hypothetical protein